ncbi:hypothetical protein CPB84DRAFT_1769403 [Gymnopilus junonius]|uniref:Uncharacterized protein n=1 Tax=Gymnopilus junonius TaxID=109634 RepID=A0A9P5TQD0_GYMJU|nr:hypothetical protein CPB84DRAFT_1769403 [Gymnopilus junonius]
MCYSRLYDILNTFTTYAFPFQDSSIRPLHSLPFHPTSPWNLLLSSSSQKNPCHPITFSFFKKPAIPSDTQHLYFLIPQYTSPTLSPLLSVILVLLLDSIVVHHFPHSQPCHSQLFHPNLRTLYVPSTPYLRKEGTLLLAKQRQVLKRYFK